MEIRKKYWLFLIKPCSRTSTSFPTTKHSYSISPEEEEEENGGGWGEEKKEKINKDEKNKKTNFIKLVGNWFCLNIYMLEPGMAV